jgi:nicotinate-nucleotide pyrophosphorylase (carboxylating)
MNNQFSIIQNEYIEQQVGAALREDVGSGDLTAALIPATRQASASVKVREPAILCGRPWFDAVFRQVDPAVTMEWHVEEGDAILPDQIVVTLRGPARSLLTGERTALNFLQTLSAVATLTSTYVDAIKDTAAVIVDTRKTLPGLRLAEKYAVRVGGGTNHRIGLYDGILVKENHVAAAGGVGAAVRAALKAAPAGAFVEVEVETLDQLDQALDAGAPMVLLDNMTLVQMREAVARAGHRCILEASGGVNLSNVRAIAETGVHRISVGALTKNVNATDFSMRFQLDDQDS